MRKIIAVVVLLISCNLHAGERLMFGINPGASGKEDQMTLRESFQPLADYISKAAGSEVRTDITQNFKAIDDRAGKGRFQILMGTTHVIGNAFKDSGYYPVAKFKNLSAVFLVAANSKYKSLPDLKNSKIGVMSRDALVGPLAVHALKTHGLTLTKDFKEVREFKFQDAMVASLLAGGSDVVTVNPKVAEDALKAHGDKVRILGKSEPLPGFAISLSPDMPNEDAAKITKALLTIGDNPAGKAALASLIGSTAGNTKLTKADSDEYVKATEIIESAKKLYPPEH